ncbi:MAG: PadR family transcriptional regulator [Erysipelotrichaceae bacterium]|jgi:PadR family transcriptional regulator PadR|nr:PadR family transcriptional regulator [Erysipelotrichaceae bacterium]
MLTQGESYGYKLINDLSFYISINESTLYPILRRLEGEGSIFARDMLVNSRNRRYYRISPRGKEKIRSFMKDLEDIRKISIILQKGEGI